MDYISDEELVIMAKKAYKNSYSPYSDFKVGAALLCKNGQVYTGCNIENASYGATICAERTAIFKAVSEGEHDFVKIAIVSARGDLTAPCGMCRQVMSEFFDKNAEIILEDNGVIKRFTISGLLPLQFSL